MPDKRFVDVEIHILPRFEAGYPIQITVAPDRVFVGDYLDPNLIPWASSGDPDRDGQRLYDALFAGDTVKEAWAIASATDQPLRVRLYLDILAPELHTIPWELLKVGENYISTNANTPFSRFLPVGLPWRGQVEDDTINVLVAISNPNDLQSQYNLAALDVEQERATLEGVAEAINTDYAKGETQYKLDTTFLDPPVTLAHIEEALQDDDYHVLHYLGHGAFSQRRSQAALYLQDEAGNTQIVTDDKLVRMVARQEIRPLLVFLAACQSAVRSTSDAFLGLAPKLIKVGVPAVVAMQDFVQIQTARELNRNFYRRLVKQEGAVDQALNMARGLLVSSGRADVAVPVLLTRLKSGNLWGGEADQRGKLDEKPRVFWKGLLRYIKMGRCTPIIGPRARGQWGIKLRDLAHAWDEEYGYPFAPTDNPTMVAQYLAISQGEELPKFEILDAMRDAMQTQIPEELRPKRAPDSLTELVNAVGWETLTATDPNEIHNILANLNLPLYLTTNYDNFMTAALSAQGKNPTREVCRWNDMLDYLPSRFDEDPDYEPTPEEPLVYHLFGNDEEMDSLVLTEYHHFDFLRQIAAEPERIHPYIRAALSNTSLMFLGYSMDDWGFRVIMHGLVRHGQRRRKFKHVGVQLEPKDMDNEADLEAAREYLKESFQVENINVYLGSVQQFIAELREWWERENG